MGEPRAILWDSEGTLPLPPSPQKFMLGTPKTPRGVIHGGGVIHGVGPKFEAKIHWIVTGGQKFSDPGEGHHLWEVIYKGEGRPPESQAPREEQRAATHFFSFQVDSKACFSKGVLTHQICLHPRGHQNGIVTATTHALLCLCALQPWLCRSILTEFV